jgi:hypothetical protein
MFPPYGDAFFGLQNLCLIQNGTYRLYHREPDAMSGLRQVALLLRPCHADMGPLPPTLIRNQSSQLACARIVKSQ